ncbi:eukaryotic translation initiation factor 2-alpha kinase 3 isoform X2 [Biomphalaria glabrata]|nr:eukaryotic translation initiation factor 2-alpha kinase 3 isoform X2 [Biomphalaria glabrata]
MTQHKRMGWLLKKVVKVLAFTVTIFSWANHFRIADGATNEPNTNLDLHHEANEDSVSVTNNHLDLLSELKIAETNSCPFKANVETACDIFYVLISTIDGRISALDLHNRGKLAWSVEADSKPLYSSSLANMEMFSKGKKLRLIPSLDGALYQFDGEKVEAVPMSAESLLSSTYRLSDDSMIVGSKELRNFGVDIHSGEIQFSCSSEGCTRKTSEARDEPIDGSSVLVVTRSTQVIRSVDIKNGHEKWNFSVGQHQVSLPPKTKPTVMEDEDAGNDNEDNINTRSEKTGNYNIPMFTTSAECPSEEIFSEDLEYENYLRLVVPEGRVVALNKMDLTQVSWEHKFDSPIAKAWLLRHGKLEPMSLFDARHVPSLETFEPDDIENESVQQPLLYIGSHHKLLYIQASPHMETLLKQFTHRRIGHVFDSDVKVSWRPYLNTASVRTPIFRGNRPQYIGQQKPIYDSPHKDITSLTVWHEDYPFDTGYFLYPEFRDSRSRKRGGVMLIEDMKSKEEPTGIVNNISASVWVHWKAITLVSIVMSVIVHLTLTKFTKTASSKLKVETVGNKTSSGSETILNLSDSYPILPVQNCGEYISRFESDFDCLHCLGKGGFGVVFEAVNKVDDQHYAVKRTMLPKSEGAKEKVLREVKALAKLEHIGIVRYFNAWVEAPPVGWQEERDKLLQLSDASGTFSNSNKTPISELKYNNELYDTFEKESKDFPRKRFYAEKTLFKVSCKNDNSSLSDDSGSEVFDVQSSKNDFFGTKSNLSKSQCKLISYGFDLTSEETGLTQEFDESKSSIPFSNYTSNSWTHSSNADLESQEASVVFELSRSSAGKNADLPAEDTGNEDSIIFENSAGSNKSNSSLSKHSSPKLNNALSLSTSTNAPVRLDSRSASLSQHEDNLVEKVDKVENSRTPQQTARCFLYIQMQLYRKETLKDWLANNTLNRNRETILDIFDQIVCAVEYVHSCGLMHRDLKPSNIFFSADGIVKVGDFGLVTALNAQEDENKASSNSPLSDRHTAEVGTTMYMSPEQIAKKNYDFKIDIFSLGLIFLELWIPFSTQMERIRTLQDAKQHILPPRFIRELPSESQLVYEMTSEEPSQRPTTKQILDHQLFKDVVPNRAKQRKRTHSENLTGQSAHSESLTGQSGS